MGRTAAARQRTPFPTTQNPKLKQPAITEADHKATIHYEVPSPATQAVERKRPTVTEDDVRFRAYEIYLQRGAIPGDEVRDWIQAERELLAD